MIKKGNAYSKLYLYLLAFFILACSSVEKNQKDAILDIASITNTFKAHEQNQRSSNAELLSRVKKNHSTEVLINWNDRKTYHFKSHPKSTIVNGINELAEFKKDQAKDIFSLILNLGKEVDINIQNIKLSKFTNLEYLQINNTNFLPIDLTGLSNLHTLNFNYVYDLVALPKTIGNAKNLKYLNIAGANKIKELPDNIFNLSNLEILKLSGLNLGDNTLSKEIKNLVKLKEMHISFSRIHLPDEISHLKNLVELQLGTLYNRIPYSKVYELPDLEILQMRVQTQSQFNGISKLKKLKVLATYTDTINPEIANIPNLEGLSIKFNGDPPRGVFRNMSKLTALRIYYNSTITTAPEFIPHLKNLDYLRINNCNKLSEFGKEYKKMDDISLIVLRRNKLLEGIPENLAHIKDKIIFEQ